MNHGVEQTPYLVAGAGLGQLIDRLSGTTAPAKQKTKSIYCQLVNYPNIPWFIIPLFIIIVVVKTEV